MGRGGAWGWDCPRPRRARAGRPRARGDEPRPRCAAPSPRRAGTARAPRATTRARTRAREGGPGARRPREGPTRPRRPATGPRRRRPSRHPRSDAAGAASAGPGTRRLAPPSLRTPGRARDARDDGCDRARETGTSPASEHATKQQRRCDKRPEWSDYFPTSASDMSTQVGARAGWTVLKLEIFSRSRNVRRIADRNRPWFRRAGRHRSRPDQNRPHVTSLTSGSHLPRKSVLVDTRGRPSVRPDPPASPPTCIHLAAR